MRPVAAVAALLRRIRVERGAALFLFILVAVTAFAVAAGPRWFDGVADDGLRYEIAGATVAQRNLQFAGVDRLEAGDADPLEQVAARSETLQQRLPDSLTALVTDHRYVVDSVRFGVLHPPAYTTYLTLRYQDDLDGRLTVVDGRLPERVAAPATTDEPRRFEIAISSATSEEIQVTVGDTLDASVDPSDPIVRNVFPRPTTPIVIEVVGVFTVDEPDADFWFGDQRLAQFGKGGTEENPIAYATGLIAPEAYADLVDLEIPIGYRWRAFIDPGRLDAGQLATLVPDMRRLESSLVTDTSNSTGVPVLRTGLLGILDRYLARRAVSEATLSVAALGPLAIAIGAVALVALLIVRRRRTALTLARGRGASGSQLLTAQLWEGLLITLPAAVVGLLLAQALVPARATTGASIDAVLVALIATALLLLATWPIARRALREPGRDDAPVVAVAPRRLVFELLVVGLAVAAAWLLRERGVSGTAASGAPIGFDPFLAATPIAIGVAVGLITLRLYPIPVRALGWLAARRRDLVPTLGLWSIGRQPTAANMPLLVLMLTVAIGAFSSVVQVSIQRGQVAAAWQEIGADYRIVAGPDRVFRPNVDTTVVPGVTAVARGLAEPDTTLIAGRVRGGVGQRSTVLLHAVEPRPYEAVLAGSPAALTLTALAFAPDGPEAGTADAPIPAFISRQPPSGRSVLAIGEVFELHVAGRDLQFTVADVIDAFPGVPSGTSFVVAPFGSLEAAPSQTDPVRPNLLFVRASDDAATPLRAMVDAATFEAAVLSRTETYATMRDAPLVAAVGAGFGIALLVAGAYAALAVAAALTLTAQRRSRELSYLRTLGMTERQVAGLTVVEYGLPTLVALVAGIALGLGVAWLLEPGLELATFIGSEAAVLLQVDWLAIVTIAVAIVAVVVIIVAAGSWVARRLELGRSLRMGSE